MMTTGRSQTFETPYGTLEFVHTAQRPDKLRSGNLPVFHGVQK
jgi:hypothetical protein